MNVQSIKCVVSVCGVEGYSSVMRWMVVEAVRAGCECLHHNTIQHGSCLSVCVSSVSLECYFSESRCRLWCVPAVMRVVKVGCTLVTLSLLWLQHAPTNNQHDSNEPHAAYRRPFWSFPVIRRCSRPQRYSAYDFLVTFNSNQSWLHLTCFRHFYTFFSLINGSATSGDFQHVFHYFRYSLLSYSACPALLVGHNKLTTKISSSVLQCFDAVGWAAGRASSL